MKKQINIRLSEELIKEMDKLIDKVNYDTRSDIIKKALRTEIERRKNNEQN